MGSLKQFLFDLPETITEDAAVPRQAMPIWLGLKRVLKQCEEKVTMAGGLGSRAWMWTSNLPKIQCSIFVRFVVFLPLALTLNSFEFC